MPLAPPNRQASLTATNLPHVIKLQGRTMTWLARHCGISHHHVSRICSGQRRATPEMARRSSDLLGVPMHLLFADAEGLGTDAT
jgi:transcriptional regulator with XRE-family HTH domain